MSKKLISAMLSLCLIFAVGASGANLNVAYAEENETTTQVPQDKGRIDNRGERQMPPQGNMPNKPDGMPPQGNVQNSDGNVDDEMQNSNENVERKEQNAPQGENRHPENPMMGGMDKRGGDMPASADVVEEFSQDGLLGFVESYSTPIISIILLIFAFIFVVLYKKRQY